VIRPATVDDHAGVAHLLSQLHGDSARGHTLPRVDQHSTTLVQSVDDEINGVILATAVNYGIQGYAMIEELVVAPAQRGSGAGTALVDAVHAWASTHGCTVVFVSAIDQNANEFYRSKGYDSCVGPWLYHSLPDQ
jgi:N-acetylglutamate synthase-like GNAT family acetyltransferase